MILLTFVVSCGPPPQVATAPTASPTPTPTASPTPTPEPTPTPQPTLAVADSYFRTLQGYEWVTPPPEADRIVRDLFNKPELAQYSSGFGMRLLTKNGDPVDMFVLVMALQPSYAALPGALDSIGQGFSTTKPKELTLSGRRVLFYGETNPKVTMWAHRTFIVVLYGTAEAPMTAFATLLIDANQ
ncbi:MAG TPA: hypothetical protein VGR85_02505 [Candidatus Limnocylindria bacterium]|jgi:hypothetical protein|nr:hypothetical protein [Candidatus Limnocylindria bacterium]